MKKYIVLLLALLALPSGVSAQSLQGASNTLQNQTQQTQQQSGGSLNQTGSVQTNNGGALSQSAPRTLNVVSDPNQVRPDATVTPSSTLQTEISATNNRRNPLVPIAVLSTVIVIVGALYLQRSNRTIKVVTEEPKPATKPEPMKQPKKTRAPRKNNKKKKRSS